MNTAIRNEQTRLQIGRGRCSPADQFIYILF